MRKITILGMGPSAYERKIHIAEHTTGEVWSLNNAYGFYRGLIKFDRFFELHNWQYLKAWQSGTECHFSDLEELGCEVWAAQPLPLVRNIKLYPFIDIFRHHGTNYFLGSPSLMLALALYEHDKGQKIEEIRSWGIDTSDPSHSQQRQSWAFWLSKVQERGIKVTGTALQFFAEEEKDEGLRGLREVIGRGMNADYTEL
jgi:hypothetical protein